MVHNTSTVPAGGYSQNKRPYPPPAPPLPPPPKRNSFYDHFNKRSIQDPNKNWNSQPYSAESQIPPNRAATPKPNPGIFSPSRPCTPITEGKSESRKRMDDLSRSFFKEQVKLKETNIAAFLDAGLDSLGKLDEIDKVKSDCKYLVSLSQPGLISQQRMETIRNLYYNLDKWSAEYSNSSEILNRYGDLKLLQESQQAEADAKLNDIHAIQESEGEILHELAGAEAKLLDLEKQVLEYKKFVADRKNRLASTQSQILKLCLDVQAMQMNAIKAAADQKSLADEVEKAKRDRSHLEERWQNISSELRLN